MERITRWLGREQLAEAAEYLRRGELVAFPTETVYGLGADALSEEAVRGIFAAKGRPADNPLIIHCHSVEQVSQVVQPWPDSVQTLMDVFWPGPLTLILPKRPHVPLVTTGGLKTAAVRIPDHPLALALIRAAGVPLAAPSANRSGRPSPTRAEHVRADLDGRIAAIVDGGATGWGLESTVLDCTTEPFRLLRPGGITMEQLQKVCEVITDPGIFKEPEGVVRSPGMKYKHYAPECRVIVVVGDGTSAAIREMAARDRASQKLVGVLAFTEHHGRYEGLTILDLGSKYVLQEGAARLYHLLREADILGLQTLYVEGMPDKELGMAIMNRLLRASGFQVIAT